MLCGVVQAFKAQMGDKAAGVNDDLLQILSQQQLVSQSVLLHQLQSHGCCATQSTLHQAGPSDSLASRC